MIELSTILADLRSEIDRLVDSGMPQPLAEQQAVITVMSQAAYAQTATPYEVLLLSVIERVTSETRRPVATNRICSETGMDYFAAYWHLRNLERRGLLQRPAGPRSGWKVT